MLRTRLLKASIDVGKADCSFSEPNRRNQLRGGGLHAGRWENVGPDAQRQNIYKVAGTTIWKRRVPKDPELYIS